MEKQKLEELKARIVRGEKLSQKELLELIDALVAKSGQGEKK